jgi:hypothetical protein
VDATQTPEEWRPILGYEGRYEVSDHGRVRSISRQIHLRDGRGSRPFRGRVLKANLTQGGCGYYFVGLPHPSGNHRRVKCIQVHVLVLEAFVRPRPPGLVACHNDGNRLNNHLSNLRWDTPSENSRDVVRHGTHNEANKTHCKRGHPFDSKNTYITRRGNRMCRACQRLRYTPKDRPPP